jgi:hypothetical protein
MTLEIPASIAISIFAGAATFFGSLGVFRGKLAELDRRLSKVEGQNEKTAEVLSDAKSKIESASRRISDIAELKDTAVTRELFAIRMSNQDETMRAQTDMINDIRTELRIGLDRKVSVSAMAVQPYDPPEPPAPRAPLPPMRPRAPSRPAR